MRRAEGEEYVIKDIITCRAGRESCSRGAGQCGLDAVMGRRFKSRQVGRLSGLQVAGKRPLSRAILGSAEKPYISTCDPPHDGAVLFCPSNRCLAHKP